MNRVVDTSRVARRMRAVAAVGSAATIGRVPRPARIQGGGWMITWPDAAGLAVRRHSFESGEARFAERLLAPGMTFVDVGAHGGFYSILARRRVGPSGDVIAFEPSERERRRLELNLRLNRFRDVRVVPSAVGEAEGETDFFVVHGIETGFSGRRRPDIGGRIEATSVPLTTLDSALTKLGVQVVDLLKIDVEGGELAVFIGAASLLERRPRPVVLCELSDARSSMWGYSGRAAYDHIVELDYRWFAVEVSGLLVPSTPSETYHANLVAVPSERMQTLAELVRVG